MDRSLTRLLLAALLLLIAVATLAWGVLRWAGYEVSIRTAGASKSSFVYVAGSLDDGALDDGFRFDPVATDDDVVPPDPEVKNLIVLLADGLGFSHLAAARAALAGARGRLTMERFPVTSWHTTFSSDGMYTDSGAGATALATGVLTTPGYLSVDADGRPVTTLMEEALAAGKSAAVVTDSYLWDASPAAWLVHHDDRRDFDEVARQMAASGVSLAIGEAWSDDEATVAARIEPFRDAGYAVVRSATDLHAAMENAVHNAVPVVAVFPPGSIADPDVTPELADLAELALRHLAANPHGFVLFIETEEVDSGAHDGDLDRVIRGLGDLDAAARRMARFARDRTDTLVIFTGDHETGGLALANVDDGEPLEAMWAWGQHTGAPVPLLAWGAGAEHLAGVHDNAEVGRVLRGLMFPAPPAAPPASTGD